jgi:hypothetical protein
MSSILNRTPRSALLGAAMALAIPSAGLAATQATSDHAAAASLPATAASLPACHVADLSARIVPGSPGAGQRYGTLVLTNRSSHSCHTYGYVGMAFLDAHGHTMATDVVREATSHPRRVVLAPGQHATSQLHWSAVPGTGDTTGPCVTAPRRVEITPPDMFNHLVIAWKGGVACERGRVDTTPLVHAG